MKHYMFDIDGTLVQTHDMDQECFLRALHDVTGIELEPDWGTYPHVTDRGILQTFIERHAPHYELSELESAVKRKFIANVRTALEWNPVNPVNGAIEFIRTLQSQRQVVVSFATGGWLETALLKLESAGFETANIKIASSNDHYSRIEIMSIATEIATGTRNTNFTYFGDGEWDVRACKIMGVHLVLVGDRVAHQTSTPDFVDQYKVLELANGG